MFFTATKPPAVWKSAKAPATKPAFDSNSANSALLQVFEEPLRVVAVVVSDEFFNSLFSVTATCSDFTEASEVSAFDSDPLSVFIGCVFSMMHTFQAIEFNPSFLELFLTATMFIQHPENEILVILLV